MISQPIQTYLDMPSCTYELGRSIPSLNLNFVIFRIPKSYWHGETTLIKVDLENGFAEISQNTIPVVVRDYVPEMARSGEAVFGVTAKQVKVDDFYGILISNCPCLAAQACDKQSF